MSALQLRIVTFFTSSSALGVRYRVSAVVVVVDADLLILKCIADVDSCA
jgi:hypothetical protein